MRDRKMATSIKSVLMHPQLTHRSFNKELCWAAARAQPRATLSEELIVRFTRPLPFAATIHGIWGISERKNIAGKGCGCPIPQLGEHHEQRQL